MEIKHLTEKNTVTKSTGNAKRGQAAIFDGITLLLLVSASVALMFAFLGDYGTSQAKVLRSSHTLNYVQSIGKTIYYIDVKSLANNEECKSLESFSAVTVSDLVKRDVSDNKFNDRFGESEEPNSPGKTALRCALKELMKPVTGAGFDYNAEVLSVDSTPPLSAFPPTPESPELITSLPPTGDSLYQAAAHGGCTEISQTLREKQLLAIATPFRVFDGDGRQHDHQLRICMWPSERR